MKGVLILLFALVGWAAANNFPSYENHGNCGENCYPTCKHPNRPPCHSGCKSPYYCEHGYVWDEYRHKCGRLRDCKRRHRCGPNEVWGRCPSGCEPTCKHPNPIKDSDSCERKCTKKGCVCKLGFVRDKHGNCIPKELCPKRHIKERCGKNEKNANDTECVPPAICQSPRCFEDKKPEFCPLYCVYGGCVCKHGYLRNQRAKCVKPDHCNRDPCSKSKSKDSDDCDDTCENCESGTWEDSDDVD